MSTTAKWVESSELDRIAEVRAGAYGGAGKDLDRMKERLLEDRRAKMGDFLLVERDGEPVGTATAQSMRMWVRGGAVATQGVAWVGTIKTARRRAADGPGVATIVMREILRKARERGEVASALMPFRVSFYEHFGYGIVERRVNWTLPLGILPTGDTSGIRMYRDSDRPSLAIARQKQVEAGQCDFERPPEGWDLYFHEVPNGLLAVDQPGNNGPIEGWMFFKEEFDAGKRYIRVVDIGYFNDHAMVRQLGFLSTLKDQYTGAKLTLPIDVPLNWLLKERQVPHRVVEHPVAMTDLYTRMQLRVLDHKRFLEAMHWPAGVSGFATIGVKESEGQSSRFHLDVNASRATVKPLSTDPDITLSDVTWAAIASGDLEIDTARRMGLLDITNERSITLLRSLASGPKPYSNEYF